MRLVKGSKVEILVNTQGHGVEWHGARIISGNGHSYNVEYDYPSVTAKPLSNRVPRKFIRSCPPAIENIGSWECNDTVEVWDAGCWFASPLSLRNPNLNQLSSIDPLINPQNHRRRETPTSTHRRRETHSSTQGCCETSPVLAELLLGQPLFPGESGVYDGHGCSHVATMCKERLHEIVEEEREKEKVDWKSTMEKSFIRMDEEVLNSSKTKQSFSCKCELQTPHCDAVGSTAVVAVVTPEKIIVSNCGDSRAVLCRNGVAIPLSTDHKPDRPDELDRINKAGGRVIYWDGARVLGVLAMSRAIGDNYLKPYVISEPEVTITERSDEDECLILASDGLWDVVQNDTACRVVQMCLKAERTVTPPGSPGSEVAGKGSDKACSDASILLTKLALARNSSDNVSVVVVDLRRDQRQQ